MSPSGTAGADVTGAAAAPPAPSKPSAGRQQPWAAWLSGLLLLAVALRIGSGPTAHASYLVLAIYAFGGRDHAVRALFLSWFFNLLNPTFDPASEAAASGRYLVIFAAAASVFIRSRLARGKIGFSLLPVLTGALAAFLIFHSAVLSEVAGVSLLKAISWFLVMITLLAAWQGLDPVQRDATAEQIFWLLAAMLAVSAPLLALPAGYVRNGMGFQGIFNHPQVMGPTAALVASWAIGRMFGERRPGWSLFLVAGICLVFVLYSEARTAALAMVIGVASSLVFAPILARSTSGPVLAGLGNARIWSVAVLVALAAISSLPSLQQRALDFISKSQRAEISSVTEAFAESRGAKIDQMMANIRQDWLSGIGFGIASDPSKMEVERDPVFGVPIGASVEKGVGPLAILEETGAFGAALTALWTGCLLVASARGGVAPMAVCATALALNMGEYVLFSPGGMGLLLLILLGWSGTSRAGQVRYA